MFNPFKKQIIYFENEKLALARETLEILEVYKSLDAKDKKALSIFNNDVRRLILRAGDHFPTDEKYEIAKTTFNNYRNENKDAVVNDLIVERILDREEIHEKQKQEKEKWTQWETNPKKALVVYGVVVSVLFTVMALYQFTVNPLTSDGLRFGHRVCIDEGVEMGREVCEAWEPNPSYYTPAGEDILDMLKRIGIMIGVLWFPYITYKWYKKRKAE